MRWTMPCPHCKARGIARVMLRTSDLCWNVDFQCDNVLCGHTYRTALTMTPEGPVQRTERRESLSLFDDSPDSGSVSDDGDASSPGYFKGD
ncbi:bacteriophage transcriptional activator-related transcription regulator protein [Burkholderia lata]|nr:bacteriophage transcriptional activator-related transcription regulator protein [Burkholderia lata]